MAGNDPLLEGKRFLVSGGGRGLGGEICRVLGEAGARVIIADLDLSRASACAASLRESGADVEAIGVDVSDADAVDRLFAEIGRAGGKLAGRLDGIINNAAIDITLPVEEVDTEQWRRVLMVNLYGPYLLAHAAVPLMKTQGSGHIVNIASTAGIRPRPGLVWYNGSKGAVITASKAMAAELGNDNIRVNCVNPVIGATGLLEEFMGMPDTPENRAKFLATIPMGRMSTPPDVANACLYLASDEAAFITGTCIEVDGGRCV